MKKKKFKKLSLTQINDQLSVVSDKIEEKMNLLQQEYMFTLTYSFKPITEQELKDFKDKSTFVSMNKQSI